jgi:hypothetical protein
MTLLNLLLWAAVLLLLPVLFLAWATESTSERARRLRRSGWSQQRIATHLGVSRYRVRLMIA